MWSTRVSHKGNLVAAQVILPLQRFQIPKRSSSSHCRFSSTLTRWRKNGSRLYARHILEIAAASATLLVNRTRLQEAAAIQTAPSQWIDWQRKDPFTDLLLTSLGGNNPFQRLWMATCRIASLALLASPFIVLAPLSLISQTAQDISWDYALWGIEQAGPTFIKLVQWATTRQDMFSQEFCSHFGTLRDETRGHSWEETLSILKEELGEDYHQLLELERTPIGSGCIAQVYRGRLLKPTSVYPKDTEIALKVCVCFCMGCLRMMIMMMVCICAFHVKCLGVV